MPKENGAIKKEREPKVVLSLWISADREWLQIMLGCLEQRNQKVRMHLTSWDGGCHFSTHVRRKAEREAQMKTAGGGDGNEGNNKTVPG